MDVFLSPLTLHSLALGHYNTFINGLKVAQDGGGPLSFNWARNFSIPIHYLSLYQLKDQLCRCIVVPCLDYLLT
jgi:hypothetical protein